MGYKLFFDSSAQKLVTVRLFRDNDLLKEISETRELTSQVLLPTIDRICRDCRISLKDINEVEIYKGPGSYTGLKVGAAVANIISWYLKIPVNGKYNKPVEPVFD